MFLEAVCRRFKKKCPTPHLVRSAQDSPDSGMETTLRVPGGIHAARSAPVRGAVSARRTHLAGARRTSSSVLLIKWLAPFGTDLCVAVHDMTGRYPFDSAQGPDHSRRSYGRNIGVWRSKSTKRAGILLRRFPQRKFPLNLRILSFPEQMANAICHEQRGGRSPTRC